MSAPNPRAETLAALLAASQAYARAWCDRAAPENPTELAQLATFARGFSAAVDAVADHAGAASLAILDEISDTE